MGHHSPSQASNQPTTTNHTHNSKQHHHKARAHPHYNGSAPSARLHTTTTESDATTAPPTAASASGSRRRCGSAPAVNAPTISTPRLARHAQHHARTPKLPHQSFHNKNRYHSRSNNVTALQRPPKETLQDIQKNSKHSTTSTHCKPKSPPSKAYQTPKAT